MKFGEKLSFLRKQRGMTQLELAEKLDISRQAVSRWEQGTSEPSTENLVSIGKLFDISVDALVNENVRLQAGLAVQVTMVDKNKCDHVKSNNEYDTVNIVKNIVLVLCTIMSIVAFVVVIYFVAFKEPADDLIRIEDIDPEYIERSEVIGWPDEWQK